MKQALRVFAGLCAGWGAAPAAGSGHPESLPDRPDYLPDLHEFVMPVYGGVRVKPGHGDGPGVKRKLLS